MVPGFSPIVGCEYLHLHWQGYTEKTCLEKTTKKSQNKANSQELINSAMSSAGEVGDMRIPAACWGIVSSGQPELHSGMCPKITDGQAVVVHTFNPSTQEADSKNLYEIGT